MGHFLHRTAKRLMEKENYRELLRYPVAGISGFAVDYLLYLLLLWAFGEEWYLLWKGVAFLAGLAVNYLLCMTFVFRHRPKQTSFQIGLFLLAGVGALLLNWLLLHLAVEVLEIPAAWANLPVSIVVFVYNFWSKRMVFTLFRHHSDKYS